MNSTHTLSIAVVVVARLNYSGAEVQSFYEKGWRDISKRFFADRPWPAARDISDAVKGDRTFLALYRVLYFRHLLTKVAPHNRSATLRQHVEAWEAYTEMFELLLDGTRIGELDLPASWVFEMVAQDVLYHYQQFHDLRAAPAGALTGGLGDEDTGEADDERGARFGGGSSAQTDETPALDDAELSAVWQLRQMLSYLHRLADASDVGGGAGSGGVYPTGLRNVVGYFALLALGKLYVKQGDYGTALEMMRPLGVLAGEGLYIRLAKAHIGLTYYAGFALMMSRRCVRVGCVACASRVGCGATCASRVRCMARDGVRVVFARLLINIYVYFSGAALRG